MPAIIESRKLSFGYGQRTLFDSLSFAVESGDMVALLGANGVGKTTLLNMVAGLLRSVSGDVLVNGRLVTDWPRRDLSRFVALVPQQLDVPFSFRVEEIVSQGRAPHLGRFGTFSSHDHMVVRQAMEAVDATDLRDRVYSDLSGGEKQRVKIAIGLAQEPQVMLLDEPTQHLDIGRQIEVVRLLKKLNAGGITVLAAIHDLSIVRDNFARAIMLTNASCECGTTAEMLRPELLERAFGVDATTLPNYHHGQLPSVALEDEPSRDCRQATPRKKSGRHSYLPRGR